VSADKEESMKRVFSKAAFKVSALIALVAVATISAVSAWSPERPTYTIEKPAPHVTFNSITNNPNEGDERAFFEVKDATHTGKGGFLGKADVTDGQTLLLRVYVHNNAADNLNGKNFDGPGVAKNTKVRVHLPTAIQNKMSANAYISADNAKPKVVASTIDLTGKNSANFGLEYVKGSAVAYTNAVPKGIKLSDSIVGSNGARIGYKQADGIVPGCFKYDAIVTLKVKVKMPRYKIDKTVRHEGQTSNDWKESIKAKPGKNVEWRIGFENTGKTELKQVLIADQVPTGLTVVPNSIKLFNGNYPQGHTFPNSAIQKNGRDVHVNIGNYNPGIRAVVTFKTKIADEKALKCGTNRLVNRAFATPKGFGSVNDVANVVIERECKEEKPELKKPVCDLLELKKLGGRKVEATVKYTVNDAKFKSVTFDFGDGSNPLLTDKTTVEHTYAGDGEYTISAKVHLTLDGKDIVVDGEQCTAKVKFETPEKPEKPKKPEQLPVTGAGSIAGIFAATSAAGAIAHRIVLGRRVK
jgi:uncharacterized repeat protein (TIGR01451 family)